MPLTPFQKLVLRLIAANRSAESHVAGGLVINRGQDTPRYSADIDFFHDSQQLTLRAAESDVKTLEQNEFLVTWLLRQPGFCRAVISKGNDTLKLEWVQDTTFRFFPVVADPDFGYALHLADVAVNKTLAAGGRREARDFIDLLYLHSTYLHVGALIWAACGKDPGFSPEALLECIDQHRAISPQQIAELSLFMPIDAVTIRRNWTIAKAESEKLFCALPATEVGCLYLDPRTRTPVLPEPSDPQFIKLQRHRGSLFGAWPIISAEG